MTTAVLGSGGQLGLELCAQLGDAATPLDQEQLDITSRQSVLQTLGELKPSAVINAAAFTDVDGAESQPDVSFAVNKTAVAYLAEACSAIECPLVHVSTDYVFGADTPRDVPYRENEPTCPRGVYAQSKWEGEQHATKYDRHIVVRTCGLYGRPGPNTRKKNFIDTMLSVGKSRHVVRVVNDQACTPSYVPHVARALLFLLEKSLYGIYHVTNQGATNWAELAQEVFRQAGMCVEIVPISTAEYGAPAPRPRYSVLDTNKYHSLGGPVMPTWQQALKEYLESHASG